MVTITKKSMLCLRGKFSRIFRKDNNLLPTTNVNSRQSFARIGCLKAHVSLATSAVSLTETTNSRKRVICIPITKQNLANSTSRVVIVLMATDANTYTQRSTTTQSSENSCKNCNKPKNCVYANTTCNIKTVIK